MATTFRGDLVRSSLLVREWQKVKVGGGDPKDEGGRVGRKGGSRQSGREDFPEDRRLRFYLFWQG